MSIRSIGFFITGVIMGDTVKHQPSSNQYIKVVSGTANDFLLQNIGKSPVMIIWGTTVPAASAKGHVLQKDESVLRNGLSGSIYARAVNGDGIVVSTEE